MGRPAARGAAPTEAEPRPRVTAGGRARAAARTWGSARGPSARSPGAGSEGGGLLAAVSEPSSRAVRGARGKGTRWRAGGRRGSIPAPTSQRVAWADGGLGLAQGLPVLSCPTPPSHVRGTGIFFEPEPLTTPKERLGAMTLNSVSSDLSMFLVSNKPFCCPLTCANESKILTSRLLMIPG